PPPPAPVPYPTLFRSSRDGTRVALLSRHKGEPDRIDVVGVPRDKAGNPGDSLSETPIAVGANFDEVDPAHETSHGRDRPRWWRRSEEHTSELQSRFDL